MRARLVLAVLLFASCAAYARDRAVFIYPRERAWFRPIFYTQHQRELRAQLARQYEIELHEQIATDADLFSIDVGGAQLLVLSAHGDPYSMRFDGKRRTLDRSDLARLRAFFDRLAPDATILLQSCDTGRGFAHLVKEAAGARRRVIAARGEIPRDGVRITSVAPLDVVIECDDGGRAWDCTLRL
ncbi:MAG TPA: hypothetical protein VHW00_19660 [Thermoanaerobaculia bacterium]|nr:hypothetical protein [Thermoanaerobaculia bacterium]